MPVHELTSRPQRAFSRDGKATEREWRKANISHRPRCQGRGLPAQQHLGGIQHSSGIRWKEQTLHPLRCAWSELHPCPAPHGKRGKRPLATRRNDHPYR